MRASLLVFSFIAATAVTITVNSPQAQAGNKTTDTIKSTSQETVHTVQFAENYANLEKDAHSFIESLAQQVLAFHENKSLSRQDKINAFEALLEERFDMKTIGRFVLGRYWRVASTDQKREYQDLFRKYITNIYTDRFDEFKTYDVQTVSIDKVHQINDKDYVVNSQIKFSNQPNVAVQWRVRGKKNKYKVIDVLIEGISMSVTQRSDFSSVIQRGGGNVEVLLAYLRKKS